MDFWSIIVFLGILMVVIVIHELGHLLTAKFFRVRAEEFGIGLPPKIFTMFKRGETEYTLNWIPFGGFVRLYGENGEVKDEYPDERAFWHKPVYQRLIILLGGIFMNFVLGVFLFGAIYTYVGIPTPSDVVNVAAIEQGGPADNAGIKLNDEIIKIKIDKEEIETSGAGQTREFLYKNQGKKAEVTVKRDGKEMTLAVQLREDPEGKKGVLGIQLDDTLMKHYPIWEMPFRGMWFGLNEAILWTKEIALGMLPLLGSLFTGKVPEGVSGPIGIYQIVKQAADQGALYVVKLTAILSVNLAVLNLVPFPILDGGRALIVALEGITRRKLSGKIESHIYTGATILLILFMVTVTINDLSRLEFVKNALSGVLRLIGR
jgi:regulator of sigma E protease